MHTAKGAGIGEPVLRKEDARLVTGTGCFCDDVNNFQFKRYFTS